MKKILVYSAFTLAAGLALTANGESAAVGEVSVRQSDRAEVGPSAVATFGQLKSLVGEWRGRWEPGSLSTRVTYSLTGNGSVLIKTYRIGDETTMATLYHLDGDELMLTHYCSAGNQPRMKATRLDADGRIVFDFLDITNHDSGGHSERLVLSLIDEDHVSLAFQNSSTGNTSGVELERVR